MLIQISGTMGTGKVFLNGDIPAKCKELGIKGIGITVPGHGLSSAKVGRTMAEFAEDVGAVLDAESVGSFLVEGSSYGTPHAMSIAFHFGKEGRVDGMHLHVPYLPKSISDELGFPTAQALSNSVDSLQRWYSCHHFCTTSILFCCLRNCISSMTAPDPDYPELGKFVTDDARRCASHSVYGIVNNWSAEHAVNEWGFDLREIPLKGPDRVLISYATDDKDCPPEHGKWLGEFFEATVNEGGGKGHLSFAKPFFKAELVERFYRLKARGESA